MGVMEQFRYATKLLPIHTMKDLYYMHVYPHLLGSIAIWGTDNPNREYIKSLVRTQKKIVRLIMNLPPRTHTKPLMAKLCILNVINLYTFRVCVEMHPYIHQTKHINRPEHNHHYIQTDLVHDYPTRHSMTSNRFMARTTPYLTREYTRIWNTLTLELKQCSSIESFKTALKKFYLRNRAHNSRTTWSSP